MPKAVQVEYCAIFREQRGLSKETVTTEAVTALDLYKELAKKFNFQLPSKSVKPAVNNEFVDWQTPVKTGDQVVFIPPVAGG